MALGAATALLYLTQATAAKTAAVDALPPNLLKLPEGFAFGAATAAYQIEGAASEAAAARASGMRFPTKRARPTMAIQVMSRTTTTIATQERTLTC